ncbi:hypothetical protein [Petropleomorpha daqingensis]|uniref:ABC-2 type transport system permease protein n=1 Tax=Petropleomorpha daqingensis TaxID=2026353 RepID=A0A853CMS4_9ACTN|nr:hypothetical protein [Petropleomorpha daqingensis]NYJ08847.1 hypothetical protein [Petropleomorpha daqingensis]
MSAPLVPAGRAVRLGATAAVASRSLLGATVAWLAALAAVYASDAGPPRQPMAFTAALLFPVAAWATAAMLAAGSDDLRAVLTAADGRGRVLVADTALPLAWVAGAALTGVLAPLLFDPHPAPATSYLLGALLHVLCGAAGAALALLLHALRVRPGVQLLVVVLTGLVSGRLAVLPPIGPVLAAWSGDADPAPAAAVWSFAGPLLATAGLVVAAARTRRRRG